MQLDSAALLQALQLPDTLVAGGAVSTPSRANAAHNVWEAVRRRVAALVREYPRFPSLRITKDDITPQGAFAEAQAQYLSPNQDEVSRLPLHACTNAPRMHALGTPCMH